MVCSPYDAYRCFMETNLDVLAIGDFLLYKEDQPSWNRGVKKFKLDELMILTITHSAAARRNSYELLNAAW